MRTFSKRFAASAISFGDRYRYEPFFRTEINVLGLQIAFGFLILVIVAVSLSFLYQDVVTVLTKGITESATTGITASTIGETITTELESLQTRNVSILVVAVVAATVIFAYLIAYITLSPVRNALESQKQFIGNIAHELRTPLSTIKTNTEVRLMEKDVPRDARAMHESNLEELDRISDIINNLLSVSASVRPERLKFENVDIATIVETVTKKLHKFSERKHLEITVRMSDWRTVWGNTSALEQIVNNILKNAITYTPAYGRIGIIVEPTGPHMIELTIQDSGPGIPRSDLFHIFEPFYRADRSRNRALGGSGLGLTIVSELVKLHGGKITVKSAEGRGTSVVVLLPSGMEDASGPRTKGASEVAVDFTHHTNGNPKS